MLRSQQNCFQLQIDGCVCTSIAMKDLGLVDSAADTWWVISLSSQRLCPPRCSSAMLLDMLQELEDIVFACPRVGGHILWPKINGNLQNPLLFFPSRRQNDREQASKTEMTNRERQGKKSWERSCVLERIDKKVTSECDVETFIVGWHKHTVEVLRLARHARCHREAAKGSAVPSSPLFLRPGFLLLCRMILFPSSSNKTHSLSCSTVSSSTHPSPSRSVVPTLQKNKKKKRPSSSEVVVGCRRTDSCGRIVNSPNRQTGKTNVTVLQLSLWNSSKDARLTTRCKKKVGPPPCSLMRALLPTENCWKWLCMYFHNPFRPFALLSAHRERGPLLFFCLHSIFSAPSPHTPFVATYQGHCLM